MHKEIDGLVINSSSVREADRFLTILTGDFGKLNATAKGANRKLSQLLAGTQLFAYSKFTLFEYRGRYSVDSAEPIEQFFGLSSDIGKMALASYFAELLGVLGDADAAQSGLMRLALNALYVLSVSERPLPLIKAAFELRLMALSGYEPHLSDCAICGVTAGPMQFNIKEGVMHCERCRGKVRGAVSLPLNAGAVDAMRYIISADYKKLFAFELSEESQRTLANVCEAYTLAQLEREFKTLSFYKTITMGENV